MRAEQILFSQGFGTRFECRAMILGGLLRVDGQVVADPEENIDVDGLVFNVDGQDWPFYEKAIILLNKPEGYECSLKPSAYPSVLSLLPAPLRRRGVQPVGRLDADTTGLLLLTDDGRLNHRLTHPKRHVPKTYLVTTKHPVDEQQVSALLSGVTLKGEDGIVRASGCRMLSERTLELTVTQGKYHQVKRMLSAVSNRVEKLKRIKVGKLSLPEDLREKDWIWVKSPSEIL